MHHISSEREKSFSQTFCRWLKVISAEYQLVEAFSLTFKWQFWLVFNPFSIRLLSFLPLRRKFAEFLIILSRAGTFLIESDERGCKCV